MSKLVVCLIAIVLAASPVLFSQQVQDEILRVMAFIESLKK